MTRDLSSAGLHNLFLLIATSIFGQSPAGEDGYRLWLRYDRIEANTIRHSYEGLLRKISIEGTNPIVDKARQEYKALGW